MKILSRDDWEDPDLKLLPDAVAHSLQQALNELCTCLDELANITYTLTVVPYSGPHPRLLHLLYMLDFGNRPFDLASGTNLDLFNVDTLVKAKAAHMIVRDFNRVLDGLRYGQSSTVHTLADTTSKRETDTWRKSVDHKFRITVGKLLDSLHQEFSACGETPAHELMIQVFDPDPITLSNTTPILGMFIHCPKSNPKGWQNILCKDQRLVQYLLFTLL